MCNVITPMVRVHCTACDAPFMISKVLDDKLRQTGEEFWCPNKHSLSYRNSENQRLKKHIAELEAQLEQVKARRNQWEQWYDEKHAENLVLGRRIIALRSWITRLRKLRSVSTTSTPEA